MIESGIGYVVGMRRSCNFVNVYTKLEKRLTNVYTNIAENTVILETHCIDSLVAAIPPGANSPPPYQSAYSYPARSHCPVATPLWPVMSAVARSQSWYVKVIDDLDSMLLYVIQMSRVV